MNGSQHAESQAKDERRAKAFLILFGVLAGVAGLVWGTVALLGQKPVTGVTAVQLPCPYSDALRTFGNNVLYYDGVSIHCMSGTGAVRWSFQIGKDAL